MPDTLQECIYAIPHEEIGDQAVLSKVPLVSVAMITYNHESYIAQAIEGVLMQETDFQIELVIGEDCSTDLTRQIVKEYQKRRPDIVRVIIAGQNVGMNNNMLRTEISCRGKYIAYCEGDDYWHHPKKLQMQVDYLESHPECGLVHGDIDRLHQETGFVEQGVNTSRGIDFHDVADPFSGILLGKYVVFTCTACARRRFLEEVLEKEGNRIANPEMLHGDLPRWLYIARKSKVHYLAESVATCRLLPESASHSRSKARNLAFDEASKRTRRYFADKYETNPDVRRIVKVRYFAAMLNAAYHNCDGNAAIFACRTLQESGHRLSLAQWVEFVGSQYRVVKLISIPFLLMRRIFLRWKKRKDLMKSGVRLTR